MKNISFNDKTGQLENVEESDIDNKNDQRLFSESSSEEEKSADKV